jgi:hypothetical protein
MRKPLVIAGAALAVSLAALGGAAFTGAGLTNNAGDAEFVGGTVSQTVTGATLTKIQYAWSDASNTKLSNIHLQFGEPLNDHTVLVEVHGSGEPQTVTCLPEELSSQNWDCSVSPELHGLHKVDVTVAKSNK